MADTEWGLSLRDEVSGPAHSAASALKEVRDDLRSVAAASDAATSATDAAASSFAKAARSTAAARSDRKLYRQQTLAQRARASVTPVGGEDSMLAEQRMARMARRAVAAKSATSAFTGYQTTQITRTARALRFLGSVATGTWRELGGSGGGAAEAGSAMDGMAAKAEHAGGFLRRAFEFATGTLIERGIEKIAHLGVSLAEATVEAASFGQTSRGAFNALAQYGASGNKIFQHAMDLAEGLGLDLHDTTHAYQGLLAAQFNPEQADAIVKLGSDLRTIGASSDQVRLALANMEQVWAKGKADMMDFRQFASYGISEKLIFEQLATRLGVSTDQVAKKISEGKVKSELAIGSIVDAVKHKLHEENLGDATERWANTTMAGAWGQLKAKGQRILVDFGDAMAPEITGLLKDTLVQFKEFAASKEGVQFFKDTAFAVRDMTRALIEFLPTMREAIEVARFFIGPVKHDVAGQQARTEGGVGAGGELSVGRIRAINEATGAKNGKPLFDPLGWLFEATGITKKAYDDGKKIVDMAADGMVAAAPARSADIHAAGASMGAALVSGAASSEGLDSHSPSRKMRELGIMGGRGLELGVLATESANERAASRVARSMSEAASFGAYDTSIPTIPFQSQVQAASSSPAAASSGGRGSFGPITVEQTFQIQGHADAQTVEEAAKRGAIAGLHSILDSLGLEGA